MLPGTDAPVVDGVNPVLYGEVGLVINPLTWTRDETPASNVNNLGSILLNSIGGVATDASGAFELMVPSADATVDIADGVLICSTVDPAIWSPGPPKAAFPEGVFHTFDIPFYYYNLRANAANRAKNYLSSHTASP